MYSVIESLRPSCMSWKGRNGGWEVRVVRSGFMTFVATDGKRGREMVCSSKTHRQMSVSHLQYFPHSRYPSMPRIYMKTAATP